jgi:hypothetical protein
MAKELFSCAECGVEFEPTRGQKYSKYRKHYCGLPCLQEGARKQMLDVPRPNCRKHGRFSNEAKKARALLAAEKRQTMAQAKIDRAHAKVEAAKLRDEMAAQREDRDARVTAQILPLLGVYKFPDIAEKLDVPKWLVAKLVRKAGLKSNMKRGRKRLPPVESICPSCKVEFTLDGHQRYHLKKGQQPVCSKECLRQRQVYCATNYEGYKSGPEHNCWKHGHASTETLNKVINYLAEHGNAPATEIRKVVGECTWATVSNARRAVGIPLQTGFKHGYYTNVAKEARDTIRKINRFIKEGARA